MTAIPINIWTDLIGQFQQELTPEIFETWFRPLRLADTTENSITIEVPNQLYKQWLSKNYQTRIKQSLEQIYSKTISINVSLADHDSTSERLTTRPTQQPIINTPSQAAVPMLNTKYIFDNFVVGTSNRFAHAASIAVAQAPAKAYNPMFIYGGVGLGKTHLMQAIGHYIWQHNPSAKVFYISSENFTNELINAIQNRTTLKFRAKFRNVDVLLIDDIHFLGGKEHSQGEFFHTFNTLYDARKQIVLSCDRPPKEIANLEERLVSRFEWGLVTDLQPPDFETRIAILRKKAEMANMFVPQEVILYIAERIKTNIRKLEGALIRVVSHSSLIGKELTVSLTEEILKDIIIGEQDMPISIDSIQRQTAEYFDIRFADMKSRKRPKSIAFPRQMAMYLSRELTSFSLPEIGESFGGRDHTTVIHAYKLIEKELGTNFNVKRAISTIKQRLKSHS